MVCNYIGLATTPHDPALAIVNSKGEVVFAEATERYLQNKRAWCSSPEDIIRTKGLLEKYCDKNADLVIATTWTKQYIYLNKMLFLNPLRKYLVKILFNESSKQEQIKWTHHLAMIASFYNPHAGETISAQMYQTDPLIRINKRTYDHHLTHAAAACYSSPFNEGICAIIDGHGEGVSTSFYQYKNGKITSLSRRLKSRESLGLYYITLCRLCGFSSTKGEEWKVMGLAAYGKYDENIYKILQSLLTVKEGVLVEGKDSKLARIKLNELRVEPDDDPLKAADLAYTGQLFYCDIVIKLLEDLYRHGISDNLILGGGCALNSSCNGILMEKTSFKKLHVYSAPADDGNAVGAALLAYYEDNPPQPQRSLAKFQTPYLGETMSPKSLAHLKKYNGLKALDITKEYVPQKTAELLAQGKIIGWVQGRAEFGPRALGNRSILADPRAVDIKDRLNITVKFREEFRPFAPSILHEYGDEYFENYQESPYMERTLRFKKEKINEVPGVVHIDGTGRLQTVKREWKEKFYELILAFKKITGIPLVLNTSFNVMGKPIIHTVEDAVAVFQTSGLDVLVIEDQIYIKENNFS